MSEIHPPDAGAHYLHSWCPGSIYVATILDGEAVKIGFTIDLHERLDRLASRFCERPKLIGHIQSYRRLERWLHRYLKKRRAFISKSNETYWYEDVCDDAAEMLRTGEVPVPPTLLRMLQRGDLHWYPADVKIRGFDPAVMPPVWLRSEAA